MLRKELGIEVDLKPGKLGQFDVEVDGEILQFRRKGFWERMFTGRFPDPEEVIERVQQRRAGVRQH